MSSFRVCQVISGYYRNDSRIFQRQSKSLKDAGLSVCILTNDNQPDEILDDIPIFSTKKFYKNRVFVLLLAKDQFLGKALELDADIYQIHSPELLSLGISLKKLGKFVIYDAHEDLPRHIIEKDWLPRLIRRPLSFVIEYYMNSILKDYHAIISPHSHVVDYFKKINSRTTLITNFAKVLPCEETLLIDYLERQKIICYSGTVYLHSNQISILDSLEYFSDVNYYIAGYCSPSFLKILSKHSSFNKLSYFGRINWSNLNLFYKKARIGIVIIDYKLNLGGKRGTYAVNKIFEYMEAALPIICTDYELWKEIVIDFECGIYVEPGNLIQLNSAISFLMDHPEKAFLMGQNGREAVKSVFNWQTQEIKYLEIFKNL